MEFEKAQDLVRRLRVPAPSDGGRSDLEIEAAGMIETLLFQLNARIGAERAKAKAEVGVVA